MFQNVAGNDTVSASARQGAIWPGGGEAAASRCEDEQAEAIRRFVVDGGVLLATAPTAHMDLHGVFYKEPALPLADVLGLAMRDTSVRGEQPTAVRLADGSEASVDRSAEVIEPTSAEVLGRFVGGAADGAPAVLLNAFGRGRAFYVGCVSHELVSALVLAALGEAGVSWVDNPHERLSVIPHLTGGGTWYVNHGEQDAVVDGLSVPAGDFLFVPADGPRPTT